MSSNCCVIHCLRGFVYWYLIPVSVTTPVGKFESYTRVLHLFLSQDNSRITTQKIRRTDCCIVTRQTVLKKRGMSTTVLVTRLGIGIVVKSHLATTLHSLRNTICEQRDFPLQFPLPISSPPPEGKLSQHQELLAQEIVLQGKPQAQYLQSQNTLRTHAILQKSTSIAYS